MTAWCGTVAGWAARLEILPWRSVDGNPAARRLIHKNFENWASRVEGWLVEAGDRLPSNLDRAKLARFILTVMEGGLMQARGG